MANDTSAPNFWNDLVMQPNLSPSEKALRDKFVTQYLIDYDAWAAAIRIGFLNSVAPQYAIELMQCPYVRQQITSKALADVVDPVAALKAEQKQIKASLLREAHDRGPDSSHAARVSALGKLAIIAKMDVREDKNRPEDKEQELIAAFREFATKVPV